MKRKVQSRARFLRAASVLAAVLSGVAASRLGDPSTMTLSGLFGKGRGGTAVGAAAGSHTVRPAPARSNGVDASESPWNREGVGGWSESEEEVTREGKEQANGLDPGARRYFFNLRPAPVLDSIKPGRHPFTVLIEGRAEAEGLPIRLFLETRSGDYLLAETESSAGGVFLFEEIVLRKGINRFRSVSGRRSPSSAPSSNPLETEWVPSLRPPRVYAAAIETSYSWTEIVIVPVDSGVASAGRLYDGSGRILATLGHPILPGGTAMRRLKVEVALELGRNDFYSVALDRFGNESEPSEMLSVFRDVEGSL